MAKQEKQNEQAEAQEQAQEQPIERKERVIVSGAEYWDFEENPEFIGHYVSEVKREKDEVNGDGKAGDVIGFNFTEEEFGETHIISNSYSIEKALDMTEYQKDLPYRIVFKGKGTNSKGQQFNRFTVSIFE